MAAAPIAPRILLYLLRRDLRLADNPVFHEISSAWNSQSEADSFTHLLPIYVFQANEIEVSGLINSEEKSPYPEARSHIAGFWRCGPHRAKFLSESVWDLKQSLRASGSDLLIRAGKLADIVRGAVDYAERDHFRAKISAVWMTADEGYEEKEEVRKIEDILRERGREFRLFPDTKYFMDDQDLPFEDIKDLPNIYTEFRKSVEPLRSRPRPPLPRPQKLPPLPEEKFILPQASPFTIPDSGEELTKAILKPLGDSLGLTHPPQLPQTDSEKQTKETLSAHPFLGGETRALERVDHLMVSGAMSNYKETRNGLLGVDFSTKLSAYLALGCISARQLHALMLEFEDGQSAFDAAEATLPEQERKERKERLDRWKNAPGFGEGENKGTSGVRFELLWRDYFRLYTRKFSSKIFLLHGVKDKSEHRQWRRLNKKPLCSSEAPSSPHGTTDVKTVLDRFLAGRTGVGLIDASQRELFLTGYTSNRARQNVASFLAKHLGIDWRLGAEWYESMLTDYDVNNNWGNWQYVAGVGNDPRADRMFNPIKQAFDYDPRGEYIRTWVPELKDVKVVRDDGTLDDEMLVGVFQASRLPPAEKQRLGLEGVDWVEHPLKTVDFTLGKRPRPPSARGRGRGAAVSGAGRGGRGRGSGWRRGGYNNTSNHAHQPRGNNHNAGNGGTTPAAGPAGGGGGGGGGGNNVNNPQNFHFGRGGIPRGPARMMRGRGPRGGGWFG